MSNFMSSTTTDDESFGIPALDDWYEQALSSGQGFKSAEERKAYLDSLGDPLKHPMFATSTEDLEGNPLVDAIRALKEEDKTPIQIALMYKDEGNQVLKKGGVKNMHEAYNSYTYAITKLEELEKQLFAETEAADSKIEGLDSSPVMKTETADEEKLEVVMSQLLSNRAQVSLMLKNYGRCRTDAQRAIDYWPLNMKAHYRKVKALMALRRFDEAMHACNDAILVCPNNIELQQLCCQCEDELRSLARRQAELDKQRENSEKPWITAWEIMTGTIDNKGNRCRPGADGAILVSPGYATSSQQPAQLTEVLPYIDVDVEVTECVSVRWPVVVLYPQYGQLDVLKGVDADDMLAAHLAQMFPEAEDLEPGQRAVPWDCSGEYVASKLVVYIPIEVAPRVGSLEEWLTACRELRALRGEDGSEAAERAKIAAQRRQANHESARNKKASSASADSGDKVAFLDVHMGCTIKQILQAPGHVLAGGLLTLLVFVRGNKAHKKFLADLGDRSFAVKALEPNGKTRIISSS